MSSEDDNPLRNSLNLDCDNNDNGDDENDDDDDDDDDDNGDDENVNINMSEVGGWVVLVIYVMALGQAAEAVARRRMLKTTTTLILWPLVRHLSFFVLPCTCPFPLTLTKTKTQMIQCMFRLHCLEIPSVPSSYPIFPLDMEVFLLDLTYQGACC
jgi:hypothetical protein